MAPRYSLLPQSDDDEPGSPSIFDTAFSQGLQSAEHAFGFTAEESPTKANVERLRAEISWTKEQEAKQEQRLREINELWGNRTNDIRTKLTEVQQEIQKRKMALNEIVNLARKPLPPPGPEWLRFIQHDVTQVFVCAIILLNLATMAIAEFGGTPDRFVMLDHFYMVFYALELVGNAMLFQRGYVIGELSVVIWNWLDIIIVFFGTIDTWALPLVRNIFHVNTPPSGTVLFFVRLLRLSRLLKVMGMFLRAEFAWAASDGFQIFIMSMIGLNSLLLGLEAEVPGFFLWAYLEQTLFVIFLGELIIRLKREGCEYFTSLWNWLDFVIVIGGLLDEWLMPAIDGLLYLLGNTSVRSGQLPVGKVMKLLRMLRLLRILRLARLIKNIEPLYLLIVGVVQSMQGLIWVLSLTLLTLYAASLLGVKLLGPEGLMFEDSVAPQHLAEIFPTVCDSLFVLFKTMNGEWSAWLPLFSQLPVTKLIFVAYTVTSNWALLATLTAVVSENMIDATNNIREEIDREASAALAAKRAKETHDWLDRLDVEKDKSLSLHELKRLLADEKLTEELETKIGLKADDFAHIFFCLARADASKEQRVCFDTLVTGLQEEGQAVSERSMFRAEKRIDQLEHSVKSTIEAVRHLRQTREARRRISMSPTTGAPKPTTRAPRPYGRARTAAESKGPRPAG